MFGVMERRFPFKPPKSIKWAVVLGVFPAAAFGLLKRLECGIGSLYKDGNLLSRNTRRRTWANTSRIC